MNIERVKAIYTELEQYEIKLDPDPVSRGPRYLQGLIATCRNHLNSVSRLMLEVHQEKQNLDRDLRAQDTAFQVSFDNLLANDERIRRLPNIEDRKSTAKVFLREEISGIEALKSEIHDLEYVEKAVRHRHRELSATMGEIKLQKSLIAAEIHTGAMYGDERGAPDGFGERLAGGGGPAGISLDEEELSSIFEAEVKEQNLASPDPEPVPEASAPVPQPALAEVPWEPLPPPAPEPEAPPAPESAKPTDADVAAFLGAAGEAPDGMGAAADEYDDVFQNL